MIESHKEITLLFLAGFFGSLVRLILTPDKNWHGWVVRFIVGISSAVFLGGFLGDLLVTWGKVPESPNTFAAAGFLVGVTSEQIIAAIQGKLKSIQDEKK